MPLDLTEYGTLFLVPTPIGNLEDMTVRAVNVLKRVSLIGAEDTRKSAVLLSHYQIDTKTISYHKFNEKKRVDVFIKLLTQGNNIAIITDAGTPGISDPASIIIRYAIKNCIKICTLPGASALLPALVSSGIDCGRFVFLGFPPTKSTAQKELLSRVSLYPETLIFYESGQRLYRFLSTIRGYFGNRYICIGREISKVFETYYRDTIDTFINNPELITLKGEFTVVCEGAIHKESSDEEIVASLEDILGTGKLISSAVNDVSKSLNAPKNRVYKLALTLSNRSSAIPKRSEDL